MGCSQPKEFRTGLRIVGSFLKVKLYYNICGAQVPLRLPDRRGLKVVSVPLAPPRSDFRLYNAINRIYLWLASDPATTVDLAEKRDRVIARARSNRTSPVPVRQGT